MPAGFGGELQALVADGQLGLRQQVRVAAGEVAAQPDRSPERARTMTCGTR